MAFPIPKPFAGPSYSTMFGFGSSGGALLGLEASGLAVDFTIPSNNLLIRDPSGTLNFLGDAFSKVTFTRASSATRVNSSGLIETVSNDVSRLDYNPVTLAPRGFLVEEQRTNLVLQSSDFETASWNKINSSVTANDTSSPSGAVDADKLTCTLANSGLISQTRTVTASSTTDYYFSVFVKAGNNNNVTLNTYYVGGTETNVYFNLATQTVSGVLPYPTDYVFEDYGNGWYRIGYRLARDTTGTFTTLAYRIWINRPAAAVGDFIYLWGAQLEANPFYTSYIPTTTATVTRSADAALVNTSQFPYSATEGALIIEATAVNTTTGTPGAGTATVASVTDGTSSNRFQLSRASTTSIITYSVFSSTVNQTSLSTVTGWSNNTTNKIAIAWKQNDFALSFKTDALLTSTSGNLPVGINRLNIGSRDGIGFWGGWIRQITYIPRRITNAELQARTTP